MNNELFIYMDYIYVCLSRRAEIFYNEIDTFYSNKSIPD